MIGGIQMLTIQQIKEILPHRYPFLLVDCIVEVDMGRKAVGLKNVTANEPFFNGHFHNYPVMPGVMIVEGLAQVGGIAMLDNGNKDNRLGLLAGIDSCRFRRQVIPGDQLRLEFELTRLRGTIAKGKGTASVDGNLVCEVEITIAFGK
jgi:3-hydroxyacyl-[acyl-carrier-protein] dehydratase